VAQVQILVPIGTPRLELVPITAALAQALVDGDRSRASFMLGAAVSTGFAAHSAHVVQLAIALAAEHGAPEGGGRVMVLLDRRGRRRAIGSIGFQGPPDERGRLEIGCRVDPAHRGRGYAGEAMTAMFEWAAARLGITRFLVSVSATGNPGPRLLAELELLGRGPSYDQISELDALLDGIR